MTARRLMKLVRSDEALTTGGGARWTPPRSCSRLLAGPYFRTIVTSRTSPCCAVRGLVVSLPFSVPPWACAYVTQTWCTGTLIILVLCAPIVYFAKRLFVHTIVANCPCLTLTFAVTENSPKHFLLLPQVNLAEIRPFLTGSIRLSSTRLPR